MSFNNLPPGNTRPPDLHSNKPADPSSPNTTDPHKGDKKSPVITGGTGGTGDNLPALPITRNARGRFMEGSRANPKGRPRRNTDSAQQATRSGHNFLELNAHTLAELAFNQAKGGNTLALKLCMDRALRAPQDRAIQFKLPAEDATPNEILEAHSALIRAIAAGEITPTEGEVISRVLEARRRSWEIVDLNDRINTLQKRAAEARRRKR